MIDIVNLQRKTKIESAMIREFVAMIASEIVEVKDKQFSVAFVSDRRMKQLNEMFRGKFDTTDVLSFPVDPEAFELKTNGAATGGTDENFIGDIVISAEQAQKQADENGLSLDGEIKQLILHGVLHLCGFDHEMDNGEMNARELELRDQLGI